MEKLIIDGKVAVAVSYGYGAGWSTWNGINPMDARFNTLFLNGEIDEIVKICEEEDLGYAGGAADVTIEWIPVGIKFVIEEYDGAESINEIDDYNWMTA
jgi:hypothetical protein